MRLPNCLECGAAITAPAPRLGVLRHCSDACRARCRERLRSQIRAAHADADGRLCERGSDEGAGECVRCEMPMPPDRCASHCDRHADTLCPECGELVCGSCETEARAS